MRISRYGVVALIVAAASFLAVNGTGLAEPMGASDSGSAMDSNKNANKNVDPNSKDTIDQGSAGQPSGLGEQGSGQSQTTTERSGGPQAKEQEKASQSDLSEGKTAKAVEEMEHQKPK